MIAVSHCVWAFDRYISVGKRIIFLKLLFIFIGAFLSFMIHVGDAITCLSFTALTLVSPERAVKKRKKSSYVPFLPTFLLSVIQKLPFNAQKLGDILSSGTTLKTLFQNDIYYNKTALVPPDLNGEACGSGTLWEVAKCNCVLMEYNN